MQKGLERKSEHYSNDTLKNYEVELYETPQDNDAIIFECQAEDEQHAEEQAVNAYPGAIVLDIAKQ